MFDDLASACASAAAIWPLGTFGRLKTYFHNVRIRCSPFASGEKKANAKRCSSEVQPFFNVNVLA